MRTIIYIIIVLALISGGYVWYTRSGGKVPESISDITDIVTNTDTDNNPVATSSPAATQTYTVDTTKSSLSFATIGSVTFQSGTIRLENGKVVSGVLVADMNTVSAEMLKDKKYFDVATYPTATFTITGSETDTQGVVLVGNMKVKDITREVRMPVGDIEDASTADKIGISLDGETQFDTGMEGIFKTVTVRVDINAYAN